MGSGGWILWFVDRMDLRHWDPQTGEEEVFRLDPYGEIAPAKTLLLNLWPDRHDTERLWISSWGIGLIAFDLKTHRFTPYTVAHPLSDLENVVTAAVQTAPDLWYLAMDGQLWTLRPSDATAPLERVHPPAEAFGLGSIHEGTLCIGGTGQVGILPKPIAGANAIEGELARANLCAIGDGTGVGYWAVRYYADRVLMHTDAKGHVDLTIPLPIEDRPYEPFHLMHGTDGNIWIGTTRGLMRYTPGSSAVERIPLQGQGWDASFANVLDLTEDDTGVLWIASGNGTVIQLDERTGSCRSITLAPALGNAPPLALCRLDTAHMLIIRRNASPVVVHCRKPTMERFAGPKIPDPTFTDAVGAVVQRDGRVIVYYRSHGLRRFERSSDGTWIEDHRWYLPMRPSFNDAVRDGAGRIFFTADRGAHMLDPATDALHALDAAHGVNARSDANAARLSNGDVLLGGAPHVRFSSDFQPLGPRTPFLVRSFQAAGIDHTSQVLSDRPLELAHDRNNISIAFGRIALLDGDVFTYSYRTVRDGKEEPWNDLGRQRSVNLVGLGPGAYRVELGSAGLTAGPAIVSVSFTVLPAWWNTWWMRTSIILALIASVVVITRHVLALRYRRRMRELERQRELERVRMRISRDVHDGIGSGLTKVTMMLRNLKGTDVEQAQRIAQASRELVQELGEIVRDRGSTQR